MLLTVNCKYNNNTTLPAMAGAGDPWISVTNATHLLLDGVPMRIAERFRPNKKQMNPLPDGLRLNASQSKVLDFKYEFETELGFVKWYEDAERERAEQQRQKEQAILQKQQEAEKTAENEQNKPASPKTIEPTKPEPTPVAIGKPVAVLPAVTDEILLPQRASPITVNSEAADISKTAANVNIKDFENLAEDPFDNLELKTINDMQELETVLANTQVQVADEKISKAESHSSDPTACIDLQAPIYENPTACVDLQAPIYENPLDVTADENCLYSNIPSSQSYPSRHSHNLNRKKAPVATPRANLHSTATNNLDKPVLPTARFDVQSGKVNISQTSTKPSQPNIASKHEVLKPPPPVKPKPVINKLGKHMNTEDADSHVETGGTKEAKVQSLANALSKDLMAINRPPGAPKGFSYTAAPVTDTVANGEEGKEVKDIEWPSIEQRSLPATPIVEKPTTYPITHVTPNGDSAIENSKKDAGDIGLDCPQTVQVTKTKKAGPARPPPPVPLTESSKQTQAATTKVGKKPKTKRSSNTSVDDQVVESLLSMGFEKAQIKAAMKRIGTDTKELAEHLCTVQQLVTTDIRWQSAQQAVFMCGPDLERAGRFAKGYQQLCEFGFGDDKVKEALIRCDMDVQRALDTLVQ